MATIASRLRTIVSGESGQPPKVSVPSLPTAPSLVPTKSSGVRSPLPNLVVTAPDSLRQYYTGGQNPTYRFPPLKPIA